MVFECSTLASYQAGKYLPILADIGFLLRAAPFTMAINASVFPSFAKRLDEDAAASGTKCYLFGTTLALATPRINLAVRCSRSVRRQAKYSLF